MRSALYRRTSLKDQAIRYTKKPCHHLASLIYNPRRFPKHPLATRRRQRVFHSCACPHEALAVSQEKEKVMAKTVCKLVGLVLLLVGVLGFTHLLDSLGAHVGPTYAPHNAVHIVSGLVALYFGFAGSAGGARGFCFLFRLVFLALGLCRLFLWPGAAHHFHSRTVL